MKDKDSKKQAVELMNEMGLAHRIDHLPSRLSGGEQQRVAIARALMGQPVILLADEPTGNLDEETSNRVFDLMVQIAREKNIAALIVTHDKELASKADRQTQLKDGHVIELAAGA